MLFRRQFVVASYATLLPILWICAHFHLYGQAGADVPEQAAYEAAMNTYRSGDCVSAIPLLSSITAARPEANFQLARCYYETESYSKAVEPLNTYLQKFSGDEQAAVLLGKVYEKQDHPKDAINLLAPYLDRHPDSFNAQVELGRAYFKAGDKDKAQVVFENVLKKVLDYPGALLGLALIAIDEEHWPDAMSRLNSVIAIAPGVAEAYRAQGAVYERQGQFDKAVGPYSHAVDLSPNDFPTIKALAKCYAKLERWDQVAAVLQTGSIAEASDAEATELVQRALKDNPQAAEEYCRMVIALNPMNAAAHRIMAESLYSSKQTDRAKVEYIEILKLEKDPDPEINFRLGEMAEAEQQLPEAHHYYEDAVKSGRSTPRMALALARVDLLLGDAPSAKSVLAKVGVPDSETVEYKTLVAEADLRANDLDVASNLIAGLLAQDPTNKKLLNLAAETASKQEKYADAANFLERLFQLDSQNKQVRYQLVTLYTDRPELKGDQRATDYLKDFVTKQEQDPEGYLLLANLYRRNKDWANAKVYFDLGFNRMPTPPPARFAWAYRSYGMYHFSQGNLPEALAALTQATQLNPNDSNAQYSLGIVLLKLNKQDELETVVSLLETREPSMAAGLHELARKSGMVLRTRTEQ